MFRGFANTAVHHVGGVTAHRVGRDGVASVITADPPQLSMYCVFVFGEIDVRCHLKRIADEQKRNWFDVIADVAMRYTITISAYCTDKKKTPIICSVLPPSDRGHENSLPVYGPLEERVISTLIFNTMTEKWCRQLGIKFLDIWHRFALTDGSLNHEFSDGLVHIAEKHYDIVHEEYGQLL